MSIVRVTINFPDAAAYADVAFNAKKAGVSISAFILQRCGIEPLKPGPKPTGDRPAPRKRAVAKR